MPLTNFPGGATSYGIPLFGSGSMYDMPWGQNVWFVNNRSTPSFAGSAGTSRDNPFQSLADALARASAYDTIFVGPGHAENVTASMVFSGTAVGGPNTGAQVIPQGVRIIGEGVGTNRPTFTLTAAASTFALAAANASLENIRILCPQTGTTTNATQVTVTAAGCLIRQCQFQGSSSATALATTCIQASSAASDLQVLECTGFTITGTPTSWFSTTGTAAPSRVSIQRNFVRMLLTATTSAIVDYSANTGTVGNDWLIADNTFANTTAASTVVIKGGSAATTGHIAFNFLEDLAASAATAITAPGVASMFQNQLAQQGKQGIATTTGGAST